MSIGGFSAGRGDRGISRPAQGSAAPLASASRAVLLTRTLVLQPTLAARLCDPSRETRAVVRRVEHIIAREHAVSRKLLLEPGGFEERGRERGKAAARRLRRAIAVVQARTDDADLRIRIHILDQML